MAKIVKKDSDKEKQAPVAVYKKAYHDFEFVDKYEAGIELRGSAMKSLRAAPADLTPEPVAQLGIKGLAQDGWYSLSEIEITK